MRRTRASGAVPSPASSRESLSGRRRLSWRPMPTHSFVDVAGLMMSKVSERRQEFAVRIAIGAARSRLIRQYLTESFLIALAGAALGAAAAWYGTGYLLPFFRHPNEGMGLSINPDATV